VASIKAAIMLNSLFYLSAILSPLKCVSKFDIRKQRKKWEVKVLKCKRQAEWFDILVTYIRWYI